MKKESEDYYIENGKTFIYRHKVDEIIVEQLQILKQLFKKGISIKEYNEVTSKSSEVLNKASIFVETKKEFIDEHLKTNKSFKKLDYKGTLKLANEGWKHERRHFQRAKEEGLTPKIALTRVVSQEKSEIFLGPRTSFTGDFKEEWSLEKIKQILLRIYDIDNLSIHDKGIVEFLKSWKK